MWPKTSPCEDQPGRRALTRTLTCLVDLVAQGEAGTLPCVVRGELDIERRARRDDGGRCYVPTVLAQQVCCFAVPISDLNVVVPVEAGEKAVKPSAREMLQDGSNKHKPLLYTCIFHGISSRQAPGTLSLTPHTSLYIFFPTVCLATFESLHLLFLRSLHPHPLQLQSQHTEFRPQFASISTRFFWHGRNSDTTLPGLLSFPYLPP